jgi:hypothetical protein
MTKETIKMKKFISTVLAGFAIVSFSACTVVGLITPEHNATARAVVKVSGENQETLSRAVTTTGENQGYDVAPSQNYDMVYMTKKASNGSAALIGKIDSTSVRARIKNGEINLTVQVKANYGNADEKANRRLSRLESGIKAFLHNSNQ